MLLILGLECVTRMLRENCDPLTESYLNTLDFDFHARPSAGIERDSSADPDGRHLLISVADNVSGRAHRRRVTVNPFMGVSIALERKYREILRKNRFHKAQR